MFLRIIAGLLAAAMLASGQGCVRGRTGPPSIVLFVFDTTRLDAVSAYGRSRGTTPTFDALAAEGILYQNAYAQAPWTLPSHASLFTGLMPSEHGVGMTRMRAPDSLEFLSEQLADAGYLTVGLSENHLIDAALNLTQGFERFARIERAGVEGFERQLEKLMDGAGPGRPLFLFVNVMDAHGPYRYRPRSPFLERPATREVVRRARSFVIEGFCRPEIPQPEAHVARAMYLDGVAIADAKLARTLGVVDRLRAGRTVVTVATSDHGQHFGEHHLTGHEFSVRQELIHVPLVVHGLRGASPGTVEEPVQLIDVANSIRAWAGLDVGGLRTLPVSDGSAERRPAFAEYHDVSLEGDDTGRLWQHALLRERCGAADRVFGSMRTLVAPPFKLIWYERYPPQLYDLESDPRERDDLYGRKPDLAAKLALQLESELTELTLPTPDLRPELPPEVLERLEALGYRTRRRLEGAGPTP